MDWIDNGRVVRSDLTHRLCKSERDEPVTTLRSSLVRRFTPDPYHSSRSDRPSSGVVGRASLPGSVKTELRGVPALPTRGIVPARRVSLGTLGHRVRAPVVTLPRLDTLHGRRPSRVTGITGESFLTVTAPVLAGYGECPVRDALPLSRTGSMARTAVATSLVVGVLHRSCPRWRRL